MEIKGVVEMVGALTELLKKAGALAKKFKETEVQETLLEVQAGLLELQSEVSRLRDENVELKKKRATREALHFHDGVYWWRDKSDPDPYCPVCMDRNQDLIHLAVGSEWWICQVCKNSFNHPGRKHGSPMAGGGRGLTAGLDEMSS